MGAFEDFVNANLGIRKPLITDAGPPNQSTKAAGIPGSHYIDSNNNFLYEKTGENNSTDWIYIATLGDPRGGGEPAGLSGQIQFNYDGELGASPYFIFDDTSGAFSGASGRVDYLHVGFVTGQTGHFQEEVIVGNPDAPGAEEVFVVEDGNIVAAGEANFAGNLEAPTGTFIDLFVDGDASFDDLLVQGDLTVVGTTHVHEVIDTTVEGTISGYTGVFDNLIAGDEDVGEQIDILSGNLNLSGEILSGDISSVSGNLNLVSGGATADIVALADDVSLISGDAFLISGIDLASSTALSDDIFLINKKMPFVGSYDIPNGVNTAQVSFASVGNSNNYVNDPTVLGNVRILSSTSNVYQCCFYDVSYNGFSVKFSPTIAEDTNILDFTVYNND